MSQELLKRESLKRRPFFQQFVEVVDISLEMPVVVEMHGFLVYERLQGVVRIGERRVYKRIEIIHRIPVVFFYSIWRRFIFVILPDGFFGKIWYNTFTRFLI